MIKLILLLWRDNMLPLCFGLVDMVLHSFKGFSVEIGILVEGIEA